MTPTTKCLDAEALAAWVDGGLTPIEAAAAEAHVSSCERCQEIVGVIVKTTPVMAPGLPWWRQLRAGWLVPLTAGVAAVGFWVMTPNRSAVVQPGAPPAAAVASLSDARERAKAEAPPAASLDAAPANQPAARNDANTPAPDRVARLEPKRQKLEVDASKKVEQRLAGSTRSQGAAAAAPPVAAPGAALGRLEAQAPARDALAKLATDREATSPDGSMRWRITGAGGLERSTTGGTSWDPVHTGISTALARVRATDARTVIVTTVDGLDFQTADAGATWVRR